LPLPGRWSRPERARRKRRSHFPSSSSVLRRWARFCRR
jgi:hypothetical protein